MLAFVLYFGLNIWNEEGQVWLSSISVVKIGWLPKSLSDPSFTIRLHTCFAALWKTLKLYNVKQLLTDNSLKQVAQIQKNHFTHSTGPQPMQLVPKHL